jgi:hypothetical protein
VKWVALWLAVFGVWPLDNPGHNGDSLMSIADIALHVVAFAVYFSLRRSERVGVAR